MNIYKIQSMKTSFYINEFKLCNFTLCLYMYVHAKVGFIFVLMKKKLKYDYLNM